MPRCLRVLSIVAVELCLKGNVFCVIPMVVLVLMHHLNKGRLFELYRPRSVELAPGQYLNFYELKEEYRRR